MPGRLAILLLTGCMLAGFHAPSAGAEEPDTLRFIEQGDPEMAKAVAKAQAGLDDFLTKLDKPVPGTENYAVKIGIVDQGNGFALTGLKDVDNVEYFWVGGIKRTADGYLGIIDNDPGIVRNIRAGQEIAFKKSDIFDWLYMEGGKTVGNATACPLLLRGPKEELEYYREALGMDC